MTPAPRALVALFAAALAACAAHAPKTTAPPPAPAPAHEADPSFDWQALVIAPFGSTLKSIPVKVHEALLFKDEARAAGGGDDGECYAPDAAAPPFLGRPPDEYLLCFRQDRLLRVRAAVHLDEGDAPGVFAEACARWMKSVDAAARPGGDAAVAPAPAMVCGGRSGKVRFDARLGADAEPGAESADEGSTVFMVLDGTPD